MKQAPILDKKQYKALLAATKMTRHSDRNRLAVVLSFGAGLRAMEIAAITVADVIDANGTDGRNLTNICGRSESKMSMPKSMFS
jgi:integrase/recombinase XerD